MSKSNEKTPTSTGADDLGAEQVQAKFDEANSKGYFGTRPEGKPNEDYTLAGVTKSEK